MKKLIINNRGIASNFIILGLLVLVVVITVFSVLGGVRLFSRAGDDSTPKDILLTNLSENSASVIFKTDSASGFVVSLKEGEGDFKQKNIESSMGKLHVFNFKDLSAGTQYQYLLTYGDKKYGPFTFKTYPLAVHPPKPHEVYGTANKGMVVILSMKSLPTNKISTTTNEQGNYSLDLGNLRSLETLDRIESFKPTDEIELTFIDSGLSTVSKIYQVSNSQPFPDDFSPKVEKKEKTWWENFTSLFSKEQ